MWILVGKLQIRRPTFNRSAWILKLNKRACGGERDLVGEKKNVEDKPVSFASSYIQKLAGQQVGNQSEEGV